MYRRSSMDRATRACCMRIGVPGLLAVAAVILPPDSAQAVPARRLARRGVIVVVPPPEAGPAPAAAPIAPGQAPIVVGPGLRPWRRLVAVPPPPAAVARQQSPPPAVPAPVAATPQAASKPQSAGKPEPAVAKSAPAATKQSQAAAPESIPAPQPAAAAATAVTPAPQPEQAAFTPDWYAAHPQAWRPEERPLDWWRVPDTAAVVDWLGSEVRPAAGTPADATAVTAAGGETVGADGLRSVLVLPAGHANQAPTAAAGEWLPLGVFAVVPGGVAAEQATQYQQLLVDRSGVIRGNFYDDVSGTVQPIEGAIDRTALTASWAVRGSGSTFMLPVAALALPPRLANVTAGGRSRDVELVPVTRP
jgi:hypothetical protein